MINTAYYGTSDTWHDRNTTGSITMQTATFNESAGQYAGLQGAFGQKWAQGTPRAIKTDDSFCYIKMDAQCPMHGVHFISTPAVSGDYDTCNDWAVSTSKDVPFSWTLWNDYYTAPSNLCRRYEFSSSGNAFPTNADGSFIPATIPKAQVINNIPVLTNLGWFTQPVLKWDFQHIRLVPVVYVQRVANGHTVDELETAASYTAFNALLTDGRWYDLDTYINGTTYKNGASMPVSDWWCVVRRVAVVPVFMTFDPDTHAQSALTNLDTAASVPQYTTQTSVFYPTWFYGQQSFDKVFFGTSAENRADDFTCDIDFAPTHHGTATCYTYNAVSGTTDTTRTRGLAVTSGFTIQGEGEPNTLASQYLIWGYSIGHGSPFTLMTFTGDAKVCCYTAVGTDVSLEDFTEFVRKCVAYFGMFFTDGFETAVYDSMDTVGLYLGIVDSQGVTHGQYSEGTDNPDQINFSWVNPAEDSPINPPLDPDHEDPSDLYTPYPQPENGFGIALKYYAVKRGDISDLYDWIFWYASYDRALAAAQAAGAAYEADFMLKYPDPAAWSAHFAEMAGFGEYPTQDIVSLMAFPFELSGTSTGYQLGSWDTSTYHEMFNEIADTPLLSGYKITSGYKYLDMGSVDIAGRFGDFRDYPPYSRIELQIPYHGTVEIDPADWIGHTLSVKIVCDLMTGASLAIVLRDGTPVTTAAGQMGISVPLSKDNIAQTAVSLLSMSTASQSSRVGAVQSIFGSVVQTVQGVSDLLGGEDGKTKLADIVSGASKVAGGAFGATASVIQRLIAKKQQEYEMTHLAQGKLIVGTAAPSCAVAYEYRCRIVYHYPRLLIGGGASDFQSIYGCACNKSGSISSFSGFTEFGAADLSGIPATEVEKGMILSMLQAGIFI